MTHRVLITGASGYLGGTLLARWKSADLPPYDKLFASVRTEEQAEGVKQYGATPLNFSMRDEKAIHDVVVDNGITVVFFLIDAMNSTSQCYFIKALAEVKETTGRDVHFLHTSGAKIFSSHAGAPTDQPLLDTRQDLYDIQKAQKAPIPLIQTAVETNNIVIEQSEAAGVRSYIFVPCIVYGKGEGFGNAISIQTVAVVKAAKALRRVYAVDTGRPTWPVCHVVDNSMLYLELLRSILADKSPGYGKQGYYLASSGSIAWHDLYAAMAKALAMKGVVDDETVQPASDEIQQKMGDALSSPKELVPLHLGGFCTFTAENGKKIGWKAQYSAEHILETAGEEVDLILANLK